jgi:hypothetical protein
MYGALKKFKTDEINKEEELFKINIRIYTLDETTLPKSTEEIAVIMIKKYICQ